jgi:tetratricopeptide (TPR) repeat protein
MIGLPGVKIAQVNEVIESIQQAVLENDTQAAIGGFSEIIDSIQYRSPDIVLNGAHVAFAVQDTINARAWYNILLGEEADTLRSQAYLQLGLMDAYSKPKEALEQFKNSLRAHPDNMIAKYNYELLKRYLDRQEAQDNKDEKPEPSPYAKWLKKQADMLVEENKYSAAYQLMQDGLKQDMTVQHYQDFIQRLGDVSEITEVNE